MLQKIEGSMVKNDPTISYPLFTIYPNKAEEDKIELSSLAAKGIKVYDASKVRQNLPPARSIIDLHMEKLSDNWKNMSNLEILGMQLSEFEKWYELAIAHHQPNLIVIHGVGSGRLKEEMQQLRHQTDVLKSGIQSWHPEQRKLFVKRIDTYLKEIDKCIALLNE